MISLFIFIGCLTTTSTNNENGYPIGEQLQYKMENSYDCGPCAMSSITGLPVSTVKSVWGWKDYNSVLDDLLDTPLNHYAFLNEIGCKYKIVTCSEILQGKAIPRRTMILIHSPNNPLFAQHWTILYDYPSSTTVNLLMGDGDFYHSYTIEKFQELYSAGTPACAYQLLVN